MDNPKSTLVENSFINFDVFRRSMYSFGNPKLVLLKEYILVKKHTFSSPVQEDEVQKQINYKTRKYQNVKRGIKIKMKKM